MSPKTRKNHLLLLFHSKAVHLQAVSNVMHCYDDKDDFVFALLAPSGALIAIPTY